MSGGWERFWEIQGFADTAHRMTLLNSERVETNHDGISSIVGDAENMTEFPNESIDIVFSNSVIEHLGSYENQLKMANEVRRIGKMYFVQTPSYMFPFEPHFLFPFFHWLPFCVRAFMVHHLSLGHFRRQKTKEKARMLMREHRLLKKKEMQLLFPDAMIYTEKFGGMSKSYMAIKC